MARCAIDTLAAIGTLDPKLGVSLLLATLYYNNIFSTKDIKFHDISLKLLGLLPSLASHSLMTPLVVQTILPMLSKDVKPVLYATAIRLLCKTWEINDRIFGNLQEKLWKVAWRESSPRIDFRPSIRNTLFAPILAFSVSPTPNPMIIFLFTVISPDYYGLNCTV